MENLQVHNYHPKTGVYLSSSILKDFNPINGSPMPPALSTLVAPPELGLNQTAVWSGESWQVVADFRGYVGFDPQGVRHVIEQVGVEPDVSWTLEKPFILSDAKQAKISELSRLCEAAITAGFSSSALGAAHKYQSQRDDQLNLSGIATSGADWPFKCSPDNGQTWEYKQHTAAQLKQVVDDGITHKLSQLQHLETLKTLVNSLGETADQTDIDNITWITE